MNEQILFEKAIIENNFIEFKNLINNPNVNVAFVNNFPFRKACELNRIDMVKILLKNPKIDPSTNKEDEAFRIAVKNNNKELIDVLLNEEKVNPFDLEYTSLLSSLKENNIILFKRLLMLNNSSINFNVNNFYENAVRLGNTELLYFLLDDKNIKITDFEFILGLFVNLNNKVLINTLIQKNDFNIDPSVICFYHNEGKTDIVDFLLKKQKIINICKNGNSKFYNYLIKHYNI